MDFSTRFIGLLFALVLLIGCGSARRGEPLVGPPSLSEEARLGKVVFSTHCHPCHPGGETGLGPSLNDKPLPGFLIKLQVRHGLGAMPPFSNIRIPERDLEHLVAYVTAMRRGD